MSDSRPDKYFLAAALAVVLAGGAYMVLIQHQFSWLIALICLNIAVLLLCGYDKLVSPTDALRVPERVFFLLVFLGGGPGMLLGMHLFRHKTRKVKFQLVVIAISVAEGIFYMHGH